MDATDAIHPVSVPIQHQSDNRRSLNATTQNMQAFAPADTTASWLLFITTGVLPAKFTIPGHTFYCPGTCSSMGTGCLGTR